MKLSILFISYGVVAVVASPLASQEEPKYIRADLSKREFNFTESPFVKRDVISSPLFNQVNYYQLDMQVGNPPQKLSALLDTGSSDLWFFGPNSGQSGIHTYNARQSRTFHNNNTNFQINYVSGSARGTWGTDDVTIGGAKLSAQSFAVVNQGNGLSGLPGLVGVGVPALESTNQGFFGRSVYSNVPASLYSQGYISSPTFSLYLNNVNAEEGSVLFGAIDHSKYKGSLYSIPRVSRSRYNIQMDSISVGGTSYGGAAATLDSGTTLGSLPDNIVTNLASSLGLTHSPQFGAYVTYPGRYRPDTPVTFQFSGIPFTVRLEDLLISSDKLGPPLPSGMKIFAFSPASQSGNQVIFGDIFLRNFYVVYDMSNQQIGMALADFTQRPSQIEAISSNTFPRAIQAQNYDSAAQSAPANRQQLTLFEWIQRNNPFANLFGGGSDNAAVRVRVANAGLQ